VILLQLYYGEHSNKLIFSKFN